MEVLNPNSKRRRLNRRKWIIKAKENLLSKKEKYEGLYFKPKHRQYLVNLDQISRYVKGEGNYLIMSNEVSIPVARNQKEKLVERFGWL